MKKKIKKKKKNKIFSQFNSARLDIAYKAKIANNVADICQSITNALLNNLSDTYYNNIQIDYPAGAYVTQEVKSALNEIFDDYDIELVWDDKNKLEIKVIH